MLPVGSSAPSRVGPFRVVAELGQGGMGRVLLCVAPDGRLVAIKQVRPEFTEDHGFRARFRREVEASRRVSGAFTAPVSTPTPMRRRRGWRRCSSRDPRCRRRWRPPGRWPKSTCGCWRPDSYRH